MGQQGYGLAVDGDMTLNGVTKPVKLTAKRKRKASAVFSH